MSAWPVTTIGEVSSTFSGGTPLTSRQEFYGGEIPFITSGDLNQGRITAVSARITQQGLDNSSAKLVDAGTPLIALYGATAGVAAVTEIDGAINQAILALVPREINGDFLIQWLRANRESIIDRYTQGGQPNLSGKIVRSIEFPFPPAAEQTLIANALGDTDRLIVVLTKSIVKKRALKQGMMQQLLTGRARLPGFKGEWQSKKLSEVLDYEQPSRYLVSSTDYVKTGIPVLTAGKTFVLGYTIETEGIYDALPVVIFDDFTTASKYVSFPFKAKSSAMKMLSAKPGVNLRFVFERMQQINFVAVDHKRRWIAEFSKIEIAVPPIEEQFAIASVIEDTDAEIDALERRLRSFRAIKQGMMQELLTGRTRLVPAEVSA